MTASRKFSGRHWALAASLALFVLLLFAPGALRPLFEPLVQSGAPPIYDRGTFLELTVSHVLTVLAAGLVAFAVAVALAILVTRRAGEEYMPLARTLANLGQTFPPVAMLAVAVPLVGFGFQPTFIALVAYGLLPIFENTVTGLRTLSPHVVEAAQGMGMSPRRILLSVELPLALPLILAGLRISTIINISTAAIGSTVGARGLGEIIIAGLSTNNLAFVLQGGILVALLAILFNQALGALERRAARHQARSEV
ncbi:MAG TPA: ABC transporter permease [Microvirga sp.]|jgi:osmoprotectant transport system permease protein|nr:ABC transporter permease [Microvirga sp.]